MQPNEIVRMIHFHNSVPDKEKALYYYKKYIDCVNKIDDYSEIGILQLKYRDEIKNKLSDYLLALEKNNKDYMKLTYRLFQDLDFYPELDISPYLIKETKEYFIHFNKIEETLVCFIEELKKRNYFGSNYIKSELNNMQDSIFNEKAKTFFEQGMYKEALQKFEEIKNINFKNYYFSFLSYFFLKKPDYANLYNFNHHSYIHFLKNKIRNKLGNDSIDKINENSIRIYNDNSELNFGKYKYKKIFDPLIPISYIFWCITNIDKFSVDYKYLEKIIYKEPKSLENISIDIAILKNELVREVEMRAEFDRTESEDDYENDVLDLFGVDPDEFKGDWDSLYTSHGLD